MAEPQSVTLNGDEIGAVKVGDTLLPGVFQRLSVSQPLRMDRTRVRGRSGATKDPEGWEDAQITLDIELVEDAGGTVAEKLQAIAGVFLWQDDKGRPQIYTITHWHLAARGIRYVVFAALDSDDDNDSDLVHCSLKFEQHQPPPRKVEMRQPRAAQAAVWPGATGVPTDASGQGITLAGPGADPEYSYFDDGRNRFGGDSGKDLLAPTTPEQSAAYTLRPSVDEDMPS